MTTATLVLCPSGLHELPVTSYQALVECPRCGTRDWTIDLPAPDLNLCGCGHPARLHGPRHGLAYACPLPTCTCQPKETPMPRFTTDNVLEHLSSGDGDLDDGIEAFVSIRRPSGYQDVLWLELESTEDDAAERVTEKFRVVVERA